MGAAEDKLEIMELLSRYSHAADGAFGTAESWADVFAEDGTFHARAGQADEVIIRGRERLVAFATRVFLTRGGRAAPRQNRHHQCTTVFQELTADRAHTRTYLMTTNVAEGAPPLVGLTSVYEDEIVRTGQGWRIQYRKIWPDVRGVLSDIRRR